MDKNTGFTMEDGTMMAMGLDPAKANAIKEISQYENSNASSSKSTKKKNQTK